MSIAMLQRPVTRRALLAGSAALATTGMFGSRRASAGGTLNITAYDGFVPSAVQKQFEADTGTLVRIRSTASQAPELSLLTTERDHPQTDICTVAAGRLHQFIANGIIEPIDTSRLKNWTKINPIYSEADWLRVDGHVVGVPLVVGANVLVYDSNEVKPAPDSWGAMFDTKYKGRVTYDIEDFLQCTMLLQGSDPTFISYLSNPAEAAKAVNAARDKLIAAKSQVVRFFDEGSELQQILTGGDAVLAQTYSSAPARLILAGQPFRRIIPKEGSLAFVYNLGIVKGAPNRDAAYAFLDAMLGTPGIGAVLTRSAGYTSSFLDATTGLSDIEKEAYGIDPSALDRIRFAKFEGQALSSALIDKAVEEVRAG